MIVAPFANNLRSENGKPSLPSQGNSAFGQATNVSPLPISGFSAGHVPTTTGGAQIPSSVYQHIQQVSAKRISSLDYLRKAYVKPESLIVEKGAVTCIQGNHQTENE
jgi:hypothetical protein